MTDSLQRDSDRRVLGSSDNPFWRTPRPLVELLFREFPIAIDLAASAEDTICDRWLGPGSPIQSTAEDAPLGVCDDALAFDHWADFIPEYAYSFLNPPYSRKRKMPIEPWVERCWATAMNGRGVIAVLPAALQTRWWQTLVWNPVLSNAERSLTYPADEIRFFPHRVSFDPPASDPTRDTGNANVNTAVVIWRPPRPFVGPWTPHVRYWSYR